MEPETKTAAATVVGRLEVGGFNSRSLGEALAAPRAWDDAHALIVESDSLIVELWKGPEGDRLVRFEDHSFVHFYGCTGGVRHFDTPMGLAFLMPGIANEPDQWKLVFSHERNEHGGTIHFFGSRKEGSEVAADCDGNIKPGTVGPPTAAALPTDECDSLDQACMRCGAMDTAGSLLVTAVGQHVCCICFDAPDDCIDDHERRTMGYDLCSGCGTWVNHMIPDPPRCPECGAIFEGLNQPSEGADHE